MKKIIIPFATLIICFAIIWKWTSGFNAFTVFSHTLYEAGPTPRQFPDIAMINQNDSVFHITTNNKNYKLVNFVYLDCPFACHKVINKLDEVYKLMQNNPAFSKLHFYTVSFDLKNDNTVRLKNYRAQFGNIKDWTFAMPYKVSSENFNNYLHTVGIWKYHIPNTRLINHSLYIFLISPDNKIIRVFDPARLDNKAIAEKVESCINGKETAFASL